MINVAFTRHRLYILMIASPQKHRHRAEGRNLMGKEVIPRNLVIGLSGKGIAPVIHRDQILVRFRNPPEIAKMPVESIVLPLHLGGYRRHHKIAAVSAVARHGKRPLTGLVSSFRTHRGQ